MTNRWLLISLLLLSGLFIHGQTNQLHNPSFTVQLQDSGLLTSCRKTGDTFPTNYLRPGHPWGKVLTHAAATPVTESDFRLDGDSMIWSIRLKNPTAQALTIDDLAIPLPYNSGGGEDPHAIFEQHVVKHHFIAGNNSFIFWERPTGVGPYLVMTPRAGTALEYFSASQPQGFRVFIHSSHTQRSQQGTWRQPATTVTIPPGKTKEYGFTFHWAKDYKAVRNIIYRSGGIDVQVMPGMTLPNDLEGKIALRSQHRVDSIVPEFAKTTVIKFITKHDGYSIYSIKFNHPGENKLMIHYGGRYTTLLEFFSTQPLETLYKNRAAFITHHQQHKDPSKWYDGLFSIYDKQHQQLRGPDNADYFDTSRLVYVLTCDDPALCKAPFVAAKNLYYPDQGEIDALEYYLEHFVWGKLQRTDQETPNPYGVYGTPSWLVDRDSIRRAANVNDRNKDKMHIWRSYDYPHIMMLYYHLYQIASMYPGMTHYLDKKGYLIRAKETAKAYFTYPYAILPWYETYKWGCYNELLIPGLIADLQKEGYADDAAWLTGEWEKKVKYFLYDDPYPFRSEYAIDATAFESSHALASYAMQHSLKPDSNLWYDKNLHKWYSHPVIRPEDAAKFMDRQTEANIALRGAIEPAYYYLGSDFRGNSDHYTLSYMSQMGGWSILDYGLHFAKQPAADPANGRADYIRLGYASYLSSFALMDTTGASGWAFEPQQYTNTWIQKPQGRGPWYYDGEIDLGYGGATRMAATVVTADPIFGLVAYGGSLLPIGGSVSLMGGRADRKIAVIPRDGLRRRLYFRVNDRSIDIELGRDGFAAGQPVVIDIDKLSVHFNIENRGGGEHETPVLIRSGKQEKTRMVIVGTGQETAINFDII